MSAGAGCVRWMVVGMVRSQAVANEVCRALSDEGVLTKQKAVYKNLPDTDNYYEIHVLASEAEQARDILLEKGL